MGYESNQIYRTNALGGYYNDWFNIYRSVGIFSTMLTKQLLQEIDLPIEEHDIKYTGYMFTVQIDGVTQQEFEIGAKVEVNKHEAIGIDLGERETFYEGYVHTSFEGDYEFMESALPDMKIIRFETFDELLAFHNRIYLN